jgi:hypothetical protein
MNPPKMLGDVNMQVEVKGLTLMLRSLLLQTQPTIVSLFQ